MKLLYISTDPSEPWREAVNQQMPDAEFLVWGEDQIIPQDIDYVLTWMPPPGVLKSFTQAKAIFNLGAGVDALLTDPTLPKNIPLVRLVDQRLSSGMVEYAVHWVLHFHRDMHIYARQQSNQNWTEHGNANTALRSIGILGFGEIGQKVAAGLMTLGFKNIAGWSRTPKQVPGVESFSGFNSLHPFLARSEILISLLPDTVATKGILTTDTLAAMPKGGFVINAGRGSAVDDAALLHALNTHHIQGAALDVFNTEPLPPSHPYWTHPNVHITPHIASLSTPASATEVVAVGIQAIENGKAPDNIVDLEQGY